jgi:hypothetical protein
MNTETRDLRSAPVGPAAVCLALILASFAARLVLLQTRAFDPDELQHAHAAWAFHQGLVPYRDFFEHHMPGIYYLLAPVLSWFNVATGPEEALRFLIAARLLMWGFASCAVVLTMLIGAAYGGASVGWLSGALLGLSVVFVGRALEIRPDVPALTFWLACLLALLRATASAAPGRRLMWFAGAGLMLGCTLLFNQKALFVGPGLAAFSVWYLLYVRRASDLAAPGATHHGLLGPPMLDIGALLAACAVPLSVMAVHFWWHGALAALVQHVLGNNAKWIQEVSASSTVRWMLLRDPLLSAVATAGMLQAGLSIARAPWRSPGTVVLLFPTASILAGMAVIPAPYPQYLLPVLPAGAVFGATFIRASVRRIGARPLMDGVTPDAIAIALSSLVVATIGLAVARPFFLHGAVYPLFGVVMLVAAGTLAREHRREWAATVLVLAISAYSAQQLRWMHGLSNVEAVRAMRYVEQTTAPTDEVMDGFSGLAWFRPQSSYYWFVSGGVRARLTASEVTQLVAALDDCAKRPKLVILDQHLRALSPAVALAVSRRYEASPIPLIWRSKSDRDPCTGTARDEHR